MVRFEMQSHCNAAKFLLNLRVHFAFYDQENYVSEREFMHS